MKQSLVIFFLCCLAYPCLGQIEARYKFESFASASTQSHTPFWMLNQKWGALPLKPNNFYLRSSLFYNQKINEDWSWDAGLDMLGSNADSYGHFWFQQLYARINWKVWKLDIGSREDYISFLNPYLSSGDFMHSNNARPIPQIKISLPDFLLVPYTQGNMYIKGHFSLGYLLDGEWQEDIARPAIQNYTQDEFSHTKSIYFRLGNMERKDQMQFTIGMEHFAKWGGELYQYRVLNNEVGYKIIKQPAGLADLFRVMVAQEGSASSSDADNAYVAGSQWGAYLLKYDYRLKNQSSLSLYMQHFFDDGSGMVFENYRDNLLGIEFQSHRKNLLSGAVFEYIYTKHQTGPIHHNLAMDEEHQHLMSKGNGNDNYYNNTDYISGPSHFGKSLGTPLFLSPEYNKDGCVNFKSNRIIAFLLGLEGYLTSYLQYRLLLTAGQTWGRYYVPFTEVKKGFASQLELTCHVPKVEAFDITLAIGYDNGPFYGGNTLGAGITLTKQGSVFKK